MDHIPDESQWGTAPELEPDRTWKAPEVLILCTSIFPEVSSSASAYDVANRRWYELNIDTVVRDAEDWMSDVITKHIKASHSKHGTLPDFNVINTTREESTTTFEKKPNRVVARPIKGNFCYSRGESDILPTTTFDQIKNKVHLNCSADRCTWEGIECVFKRVEFQEDLEAMEREIRQREKLLRALDEDPKTGFTTIQSRFHVLPILAVVLKSSDTDEVLGLLMPYGGQSLEDLAGRYQYGMGYRGDDEDEEGEADSEARKTDEVALQPASLPRLHITETQIQALVVALWELARAGVVHGDITDRNTLCMEDGQLVFIDLGGVAPDYQGDSHAMGLMITWALERVDWGVPTMERVRKVGRCLESIADQT
ncbi:unnamed protein product [Clonostachys solani]|uniref:Protein kinase domain-containing protein n=1 Tax=Clonostachys solani TaxID=160281 RepID=A0A9N9W647_9HYPO|nr:unnamed protein product [Clonostachys solani]